MTGRIHAAGDGALLLELDAVIDATVNQQVLAIAQALRERRFPGILDIVPAYHSLAVHFNPLQVAAAEVEALLRGASRAPAPLSPAAFIEVPVSYGGEHGPDLEEVARFAGGTTEDVIGAHTGRDYRVFMLGFLPGFPYMGVVEDRLAAPRRPSPRLRVAAGSVGIAGRQTGIYPRDSPGGWQIIGRTPLQLFDPSRAQPALMTPGDIVRFIRDGSATAAEPVSHRVSEEPEFDVAAAGSRRITVIRPGLLTTIQDGGRWGYQASGVPVGGPMDRFSHRLANALVGNDSDAATLEITLIGPELRAEADMHLVVTGADLGATVDGVPLPLNRSTSFRAGSVLRFGARRRGTRSYIAFGGGVSVPAVLGSRATHVLSGLGGQQGRALVAGDRIVVGTSRTPPTVRQSDLPWPAAFPTAGGGTRLRVLPGPQQDQLDAGALEILRRTRFVIAPQSDRMGYRLDGGRIPAGQRGDMISSPTFTGAIQVPPTGEPIVLMADRQTSGGYPQIATIITADHAAAGQLAPGDWVEFEVCSRREAIAALVAQEGQLLASSD